MNRAVRRVFFFLALLSLAPLALVADSVSRDLHDRGRYREAVDTALSRIESDRADIDEYVVLCWSLLALGRYESAASYAVRGRLLSRYDPRIVEAYAEALYHLGRNLEALRLFEEYIQLAPEGSRVDQAYFLMGELYIRLGRFHHADISLSMAVRYQPANSLWWTRLGYAREEAREREYAIRAYSRVLELSPQSLDAKLGLERLLGSNR